MSRVYRGVFSIKLNNNTNKEILIFPSYMLNLPLFHISNYVSENEKVGVITYLKKWCHYQQNIWSSGVMDVPFFIEKLLKLNVSLKFPPSWNVSSICAVSLLMFLSKLIFDDRFFKVHGVHMQFSKFKKAHSRDLASTCVP